jgi:hypothetical protein
LVVIFSGAGGGNERNGAIHNTAFAKRHSTKRTRLSRIC